jgi:hypothetical protein
MQLINICMEAENYFKIRYKVFSDKLVKTFYLAIIFSSIFIFSCNKDNPIIPDNSFKFDTLRFRWEAVRLPFEDGYFYGLWAADTNEIFTSNYWYSCLLHIKNNVVEIIQNTDSLIYTFTDGLSPNEGYLVCQKYRDGYWQPLIKKWNGTSFSDVIVEHNFKQTFSPSSFYIKNQNDMWIGQRGVMHRFNGTELKQYYIDTNITPKKIFTDSNNRLKFLGQNIVDSMIYIGVYEYNGSDWLKIYEDVNLLWMKYYGVTNNIVYAFDRANIYKLDGSSLVLALQLPPEIQIYMPLSGSSINDFIVAGGIAGHPFSLLNWNGSRWSYEGIKDWGYTDYTYIQRVNDNYYCALILNARNPFYVRGFRK